VRLQINEGLTAQVADLGGDLQCVIIDDFLANPREVVAHARQHEAAFQYPARAYPGGVLPLPPGEVETLIAFIKREMSKLFPIRRGGMSFSSQLCVTTLQPENFSWIQRLCHTDPGIKPGKSNYASVLYLFEQPALGGTAFFQWKEETYLREMTARQQDDPEAGFAELQSRFKLFREPPRYMTDSTEVAELLEEIPARFNRFIFYSGDIPHSACIRNPELLSPDVGEGRLTLNTFVAATPA